MKIVRHIILFTAATLQDAHAFHVPLSNKAVTKIDSSKVDKFLAKDSLIQARSIGKTNSYKLFSAAPSTVINPDVGSEKKLGRFASSMTKASLVMYILSLFVVLPTYLLPLELTRKMGIISTKKREELSLKGSSVICRVLLRTIPFAKMTVISSEGKSTKSKEEPEPSIWVCNHTSMLDCFLLVAGDKKMRGRKRRPIKIVYWKQLENNPLTKLIFTMCGGIPIEMAANAPGEANEYDRKSFKSFLRAVKKAFDEGFDVGILPEGQLNPSPEAGLLPIFTGAYTLARMSKRPIKMVALNGAQNIWHAVDGVVAKDRQVKIRVFPGDKKFDSPEDFEETFTKVVGYFGSNGKDPENLAKLM